VTGWRKNEFVLSLERLDRVICPSADSRTQTHSFPGTGMRSCEKIATGPLSMARETARKPFAKGTAYFVPNMMNLSADKRARKRAPPGAGSRSCEGIAAVPLSMARETAKKPFAMRFARSVTEMRLSCLVFIELLFPRGFATRCLPLRTLPPCLGPGEAAVFQRARR